MVSTGGTKFFSVYGIDQIRQFFGFLPKNMVDALVERYKLDKYAKNIYFWSFIGLIIFTHIEGKNMTLHEA